MLTIFLILYWTIMYYFIRLTIDEYGDHKKGSAFVVGVILGVIVWPVWVVMGIAKAVKENSDRG